MINEKEIEAVSLSATKKDFYQTWNELLETASKLSERWDPTSTNESDPGIVLLKVLTAIADKLNYQIDKNTLEAFMPSAAQEESMKKLCDMLGYSMKYYQSATTEVIISYVGENEIPSESPLYGQIMLPKYTNIKNADDDINYFTLKNAYFDNDVNKTVYVDCMEGEVVLCADDTDNIVSLAQLDDNNRYYLPESQIAENGVFIYNINDSIESELWTRVNNLNTQEVGKQCYKFGFDSKLGMPYVQFPDDISSIIQDGLVIRYTRTNGANGNISYNTLSKIEAPALWSDDTYSSVSDILVAENFAVKNASAAMNGKNKETINDAYNNYKKTIGTFDTLVTCRDYINKIYLMTTNDANTTPLVSNIVVSDIRDDINKSITLCTFNEYGIAYSDKSLRTSNEETDSISHFDLVLYPFATITGSATKQAYKNSFMYSIANIDEIEDQLKDYKTISHNIVYPKKTEIACIKNYLKLNAKITTTSKVNTIEEALIKQNIYSAIYENFNSRKIDFGESIPFDTILSVIQNADIRIKNVSLEEPIIYTKYSYASGDEKDECSTLTTDGKINYNKLALRNILAGRIALFDYNEDFKPAFTEQSYPSWTEGTEEKQYEPVYGPVLDGEHKGEYIGKVETEFKIDNIISPTVNLTLKENEVIQFRAPNFKTTKTFPAYVNYFLHLNSSSPSTDAVDPAAGYWATFGTLRAYMNGDSIFIGKQAGDKWIDFVSSEGIKEKLTTWKIPADTARAVAAQKAEQYGCLFEKDGEGYKKHTIPPTKYTAETTVYYFNIDSTTYSLVFEWIKKQSANYPAETETTLTGIYRSLGSNINRTAGKMIDAGKVKYTLCETALTDNAYLDKYYIQITHTADDTENHSYTQDGFGKNAEYDGIKANEDRYLETGEWLAINYTPSTTDEDGNKQTGTPVNIVYTETTIRPNFDLIDSSKYKEAGHTPSKKYDTIDFKNYPDVDRILNAAGGMFTLNTNEQIELREAMEVVLDDTVVNIYWERNDEATLPSDDNTIEFTFSDKDNSNSYTLKEGEYIYYTDASKIDLAYYGNGTKITRANPNFKLYKYKNNNTDLAAQIASEGLLAALPWISFNLSNGNSLTLKEYQYINLTAGDALKTLTTGISSINKNWSTNFASSDTSYRLRDDEYDSYLPAIKVNGITGWQVRTILNIDSAPTVIQTLNRTDSSIKTQDIISLKYYKLDEQFVEQYVRTQDITPQKVGDKYIPLSFETNYICQSSSGEADTHVYEYDDNGNILSYKNDFKVKLFKEAKIDAKDKKDTPTTIDLNNYGEKHWTKVVFEKLNNFNLNINLLANTHGLLMFYYTQVGVIQAETDKVYITVSGTTETNQLKICNSENGKSGMFDKNGWWAQKHTDDRYYLKEGLNIVEIKNKCVLTVHADSTHNSSLVFSDLDLVNYGKEHTAAANNLKINSAIDYQILDTASEATAIVQVLKDIAEVDQDYNFYYNAVIDNSTAIDLNIAAGEKLSDPAAWYDYNNINNKFVISEIDADYLSTGITLTNSSKR